MRKVLSRIVVFALAFASIFTYNIGSATAQQNLDVSAKSSILIEATTGRILYENNAFSKMPMASTTKIMTAIVAIENADMDETVVVGQNASGVEGSSIWLSVGEKMSLCDMLFGLMLASGNDAAIAIAEHVGGSVEEFVGMMNQKAQELGAYNTNFVNPNGLPAENHYTTAYDLAIISAHAMSLTMFCEIVKTQYKTIPWEGHEWDRVVKNKNKVLWNYDGGNGVKTGFTKEAGRCLSAAAERDGMQLISVVLSAPSMFADCYNMFDYGFNHYSSRCILEAEELMGNVTVDQGTQEDFDVYTQRDVYYPLTDDEFEQIEKRSYIEKYLPAPIKKGQDVGYIDIWLNDNKIYSVDLKAPKTIGENSYKYNIDKLLKFWTNQKILDM